MTSIKWTSRALVCGLLLSAACAPMEPTEAEETLTAELAEIKNNGLSVNGLSVNGLSVNGLSVNGVLLSDGIGVEDLYLDGSNLSGWKGGVSIAGTDMKGASVTANLANGATATLVIEDVQRSTNDPDLWYYTIAQGSGGSKTYPCGTDGGVPIQALALAGRWDLTSGTSTGGAYIDDPDMFTLSCVGSATAKCAEFGYKPWQTINETSGQTTVARSLRAFHQACTRMVRADYCGDGMAHTIEHVPINVWDNFNTQVSSSVPPTWRADAEWSPSGAVCISNFRFDDEGVTTAYVNQHCPSRVSGSFTCFSSNSTFFTANGFSTSLSDRALTRNEFDYDYVQSH